MGPPDCRTARNRQDDRSDQFDGRPSSVIAILSAFDGENAPPTVPFWAG